MVQQLAQMMRYPAMQIFDEGSDEYDFLENIILSIKKN
jgi:hypothetical protein